jgi:hypothetical protein
VDLSFTFPVTVLEAFFKLNAEMAMAVPATISMETANLSFDFIGWGFEFEV